MDFAEFFKNAYLEPLPKRLLVVSSFLVLYYLTARLFFTRSWNPPIRLKTWHGIALLVVLAFALRLGWFLVAPTYFPSRFGESSLPVDESSIISISGAQIAQNGIPTCPDGRLSTNRPVGYLYMLGGLYAIAGYHRYLFVFVQILLGCLLVVASFFLARSVFQKDSVAYLIAFLMAVYPENIHSVTVPLDEYPFLAFWFLALYGMAENIRQKNPAKTFWIALFLAFATACRTHTLLMPLILLAAYTFYRLPFNKALIQTAACFALIYMVSAPWAWITYRHYGKPSFFGGGGWGYYSALNNRATWDNGYLPKSIEDGGDSRMLNETNPIKNSPIAKRLAMEWVAQHPAKMFQWFWMRNALLYGFDLGNEISDINALHAESKSSWTVRYHDAIRKMKNWAYSFVAILAVAGSLVLMFDRRHVFWKNYPGLLLLALIFGYWIGVHGFFSNIRKYRWPMELLAIFPASFFLCWLADIARKPKRSELRK